MIAWFSNDFVALNACDHQRPFLIGLRRCQLHSLHSVNFCPFEISHSVQQPLYQMLEDMGHSSSFFIFDH